MTLRHLTAAAALAALALSSGCTPTLRSDVVTFHDQPLPSGETIRVQAADPDKAGSLEFRRYAELIAQELGDIGYTPLPPDSAQESELIARVDYGVEQGPTEVRVRQDPPFARYHFYYGRFYDPFYFGLSRDWGPGYRDVQSINTVVRRLEMDIERSDDGERLFEGRVESSGRQANLPEVMPYMITALFTNFPGEDGVTKVVTIERDGLPE